MWSSSQAKASASGVIEAGPLESGPSHFPKRHAPRNSSSHSFLVPVVDCFPDGKLIIYPPFFIREAEARRKALWGKDIPAKIKWDGITKLVVLPLYLQFSISTSGSSLRLLEGIFREDEYLVNMQHTVIPSWYQREGYIETLIEKEHIEALDCYPLLSANISETLEESDVEYKELIGFRIWHQALGTRSCIRL
ncbi:hypothetical protein GUJ93_ZPchr0005g15968 [Zizania palustris]|uniref:Uncharacterized protein n=1 Tax=Zizania palustris TaxID=103762 RepID=A0A8J5VQV9_ZIZPA|nr:hypothetical protein GUJ93_ZPchr0005g15968 [Zizania palustris]